MKILVVDRYPVMLRTIRNMLEQLCHEVEVTTDGADALSRLRDGNFDLVICDSDVKPTTGLQLLQNVRADERLKAMPFIMISARGTTDDVVAAKQAGMSNYIHKPFDAETLKEKIEKVLGGIV